MQSKIKTGITYLLFAGILLSACKKDEPAAVTGNINNKSPIAKAGADQAITLPINTVTIDGSASSDPNGSIASYSWSHISGPNQGTISNPSRAISEVKNLIQGTYLFELKVTNNAGLSAKDTVQVHVNGTGISVSCDSRLLINAKLVPVGSLSESRYGLIAGTAGSKIVFAGGWRPGVHSSRVDIYDTLTNSWSSASLTIPQRDGMVVATVGDKIFFAGGGDNDDISVTSRIDIYDAATNTWSTAELSQARKYLSAVTLGDNIFFAGGGLWGPLAGGPPAHLNWPANADYYIGSDVVDIYNNRTNAWTTARLSEGRFELSATAVGNKVYFAGGLKSIFSNSDKIDIYDATTDTWSTSRLKQSKSAHAGIAVDDKIFWAAGANTPYYSGYTLSDHVEIKNTTTGVSTFECIIPKSMFQTVAKDDLIIFFTGYNSGPGNQFDIYNKVTNTWSTGILPVSIHGSAIISVNNSIYVAGGNVNGVYSNQVWKLEF